ncbi:MAG: SDR family oxidoreductase [Candidatus Hydrogenedentes bacterium]|nr:SDR family oxidoreductase [Candidatus Hydrogenedentota bacterium]
MRESPATRERPRDRSSRAALFCHDLPSQPKAQVGIILVTGASGYIGGRLVPELLARGYRVRVMIRAASSECTWRWPGVEVAVADVLSGEGLRDALLGVDTAYYLIHSLLLGPKRFAEADIWAAHNFRKAAEEAQVTRIIYLGGLGDLTAQLSPHLRSRMEVAAELQRASIPVTVLRASVIIGSGSASYEIIEHLARSSRFILAPRWADNRCQPIGIRDVIKYLVGALETPETEGRSFDIGGCDILTYRQMLKHIARVLGRPIFIVTGPSLSIGFYAYLASLRTPVPAAITRCLFGGLQNEVVCQDDTIKSLLPFEPIGYEEAVRRAMRMEEQDSIRTRWSDAYPPSHASALKLHELKNPPKYVARYSLTTHAAPEALFQSICKIGGKHGWFRNNWMWRLRGMIDRILLGVGTSRGRRSYSTLNVDDVIDFWRVEDLEPNRRLLLRAEMILPGRAWLEFEIAEKPDHNVLTISAHFDTCTIRGTLYWCFFMPFHRFIFMHLIQQIERTSLR